MVQITAHRLGLALLLAILFLIIGLHLSQNAEEPLNLLELKGPQQSHFEARRSGGLDDDCGPHDDPVRPPLYA